MVTEVQFPKIGFSMEEGVLSEWHVADGDTVSEGQVIYSLESEKSVQEIESPTDGVIKLIGEVGATYSVGALIATID